MYYKNTVVRSANKGDKDGKEQERKGNGSMRKRVVGRVCPRKRENDGVTTIMLRKTLKKQNILFKAETEGKNLPPPPSPSTERNSLFAAVNL